jgi:hypothetical protein
VHILFGKCPGDFRSRTAEEYYCTLANLGEGKPQQ